jgi:site-specific recombinase XerD
LQDLKEQRRLAHGTCSTARSKIRHFLAWLASRRCTLRDVSVSDIDDYLKLRREVCNRNSIIGTCRALKDFFKFSERNEWCGTTVRQGLVIPSSTRPRFKADRVTWEDAGRLLESVQGKKPHIVRARAIIHICSVYGLRSGEVARLTIDNFDWEEGTFSLTRAKRGRIQHYPIQPAVAQSIIAYLRGARPPSSHRELFLTLGVPFRPISSPLVSFLVATNLSRIGIRASSNGAHALRHACATQLLKTGSSLKEIADFLGHRNLKTVSFYVRHDSAALREVASFSLAEVR